jgi:hypothetical protein
MRIQVTREDIEKGVRKSPRRCAVARALDHAGVPYEHVTPSGIRLIEKDQSYGYYDYNPTPELKSWMLSFDDGSLMDPIEFELPYEGGRP